ncbi:hypothetical protein BDN70DRAFT_997160 [Pholiota conissans]|uniref:Fungal-type protein kinase domain-containing protein n=1 Tax=Pholiota conissans TaxID=109636 RepID=A0A9P6CUX0_9AGAR|nr:hypothetical protein BDN70DRAFT_997160 [Pholiota conissans]
MTDTDHASEDLSFAEDIERVLVGPMPLCDFFNQFVPSTPSEDRPIPPTKKAFSKVPTKGHLNTSLVRALNGTRSGSLRSPGIQFCQASSKSSTFGESSDDKIDNIYAYAEGHGRNSLLPGEAQTFVKLAKDDFACDTTIDFLYGNVAEADEAALENSKLVLGRQGSLASNIFFRQNRNFLFSIFMTPTKARFLRWDRAGVIVTEAFEYRQRPEILCSFLWNFGCMTLDQRGTDTTVQLATPEEETIFIDAVKAHIRSQLGSAFTEMDTELRTHYVQGGVRKVPVRRSMRSIIRKPKGKCGRNKKAGQEVIEFDRDAEEVEFLICCPVSASTDLACRGTSGYWAVHAQERTVHFLKDVWRTQTKGQEIEGRILEKLAAQGVRNVPTLVCWSDVGPRSGKDKMGFTTETDRYKGFKGWNRNTKQDETDINRGVHYRQVTKEVGYPLEELTGTRELLQAGKDVFNALYDAHMMCNRLHRDISPPNIILFAEEGFPYSKRKGILIDWEFSCEDKKGEARDEWVTGTHSFMATNLLREDYRPHHICDDVESLIYVIFYCAIQFLPWKDYDPKLHKKILLEIFEEQNSELAAKRKRQNSLYGHYFKMVNIKYISSWLEGIRKILKDCNKYEPPSFKILYSRYFLYINQMRKIHPRSNNRKAHIIDTAESDSMDTEEDVDTEKSDIEETEEENSDSGSDREDLKVLNVAEPPSALSRNLLKRPLSSVEDDESDDSPRKRRKPDDSELQSDASPSLPMSEVARRMIRLLNKFRIYSTSK